MEQLGHALIAGHVIPYRSLDAPDHLTARGVVRVRSKFCVMQSLDIAAIAGHVLPSVSGPESTTARSTVARPRTTTQPLFDATNTGRRQTKDAENMSPTQTPRSSKEHSYHADVQAVGSSASRAQDPRLCKNIDKVRVSIGPTVLAGMVLLPKKTIKPLWSSPLSGCTSKRSLAVLSSGCMTPRTRSSIKSLEPAPSSQQPQQQCVFDQLQLATFLRLARRSGDRHGAKDIPNLRREVLKASVERLKIEEDERARVLRAKMEAQTAVASAASMAKDKKRRRRHWWKMEVLLEAKYVLCRGDPLAPFPWFRKI